MTAQVIFLNQFYYPDEETQHELDKMQEFLTFCHYQFEYETRGLTEEERKKRKEIVHFRARQMLGIVRMVDDL